MRRAIVPVIIGLRLACGSPAGAVLVPGGGTSITDCFGAFDVDATPVTSTTVTCTDGDPTCDQDGVADGACTFAVRICAHVSGIEGCRPRRVSTMKVTPAKYGVLPLPDLPAARQRCGAPGRLVVPLKRKVCGAKFRKVRIKLRTLRAHGRLRKDTDQLKLVCQPGLGTCSGGNCVRQLSLAVSDTGQDLDLGAQHNLRWPGSWTLKLCLNDCNADGRADCPVQATRSFGPFIPLLAGDVPVCLVQNLYFRGTVNPGTGTIEADANISANVHVTTATQICPRCVVATPDAPGTCDSGLNVGLPCTPEATATVYGASGDPLYPVSFGCPPDPTTLAGTIAVTGKLTTGTSTLSADTCDTPVPKPDACATGACVDGACTDCASMTPEGDCVATRGGVQQACCADESTRACFPADLVRTGVAVPPEPRLPDPTYPKTGAGTKLVSTFCVPRAGSGLASVADGGRGALVLPATATWQ